MKTQNEIEKLPDILRTWNYEESVAKVKILVYKWKNVTQEIIDELGIARSILSDSGRRTNLVANATRLPTWEQYCKDIDVANASVVEYRWHKQWRIPKTSYNIREFTELFLTKMVDK